MTNALFHGTQGMQSVASAATVDYAVETGMANYLTLVSHVGNNPTPAQMVQLAQAYQFFSGMWNGTSVTVNGATVDFQHMKGDPTKIQADLQNLHTQIDTLFKSCDNIELPSPAGGTMRLTDENGKPLNLLDLVTGRPDDPKFQICAKVTTVGNQESCDWYDGNFDDTTDHNGGAWNGPGGGPFGHVGAKTDGDFDTSKMPPGFQCQFHTYSSGMCMNNNHTDFKLTITPSTVATADEKNLGVTSGESGLQWLQQHCNVTSSDPSTTATDLNNFDDSFNQLMNDLS